MYRLAVLRSGLIVYLSLVFVANATVSLTPYAIRQGFTLQTFASGFPFGTDGGPRGIFFTNGGQVLVTDIYNSVGDERVYQFPNDMNNQAVSNAVITATYLHGGALSGENALGVTQVGTAQYHMAQQGNGQVVSITPNGSFINNVFAVPGATGIVAAAGHLFVTSEGNPGNDAIYEDGHIFPSGLTFPDGLAFDGTTSMLQIIPAEVGLSDSTYPETEFTIPARDN
jgi:hypothetical protein